MKEPEKFLQFNGRPIYFLTANGVYWIAIKPLCEVLEVNYNRQFQNLKEDGILSRVFAKQQMHDASGRLQEMICLPEKFVYGWLFSLRSDSPQLLEYKQKCYELLFDYFHGTLTERQSLLKEKTKLQIQIEKLEALVSENADYQELQRLKALQRQAGSSLKQLDQSVISAQLDIWKQELPEADAQ